MTAVLDRENLVRKIQFPRVVVPLAAVLTSVFNLLTNLVAVGGVRDRQRRAPALDLAAARRCCCSRWSRLATGVSMLLSALYVRFRDVQPIWEVVLQVLFYARRSCTRSRSCPARQRAR